MRARTSASQAWGSMSFILAVMIRLYMRKYEVEDVPRENIQMLVFFDTADRELMPKMYWDVDWRNIKKRLREETRALKESGF